MAPRATPHADVPEPASADDVSRGDLRTDPVIFGLMIAATATDGGTKRKKLNGSPGRARTADLVDGLAADFSFRMTAEDRLC